MLDVIIGQKLYDRVMQNPGCKNKFWGFFWRGALLVAAGYVVVMALLMLVLYATAGRGYEIYPFQIALLAALGLLVSCVTPIVQYKIWSRK